MAKLKSAWTAHLASVRNRFFDHIDAAAITPVADALSAGRPPRGWLLGGDGVGHVYQLLFGTPEAAEATRQTGEFLRARVR
jgi:hypothetical protein